MAFHSGGHFFFRVNFESMVAALFDKGVEVYHYGELKTTLEHSQKGFDYIRKEAGMNPKEAVEFHGWFIKNAKH